MCADILVHVLHWVAFYATHLAHQTPVMSEVANTISDNNGDAGLNGTVNITQFVIVLLVENCMMIISFTFERFVMVVDSGRLSFFNREATF